METEELNDYLDACRSQLDNVLSSPIGPGDYRLPSADELDEMTYLEQQIEDAEDWAPFFTGGDKILKDFFNVSIPKKSKVSVSNVSSLTIGLDPVVDDDSEVLILGSLPGKASLQTKQYYVDGRNQFWKIMEALLNVPVPHSYDEKIQILSKSHIALWDVLKSANRIGSSDSKIKNPEFNDIVKFLSDYPKIRMIALNGTEATQKFESFMKINRLPRKVHVVSLPSTSPQNQKLYPLNKKIELWKNII